MHHSPISIRQLSYSYGDGTPALQEINLAIKAGERVALVGANGSGKSTLLLHLNGIILPQQGEIVVGDWEIVPQHLRVIRNFVGLVFQNPDDQIFMPTVWEDITFGLLNQGLQGKTLKERALQAMVAVGLNPDTYGPRLANHLSGGEKKRVAIAGVLAMQPQILVLDEPSAQLDPRSRRQLIQLLQNLPLTLLVATHDLDLALELCDRTIVLSEGQVVYDGLTTAVMGEATFLAQHSLETPLSYSRPYCQLDHAPVPPRVLIPIPQESELRQAMNRRHWMVWLSLGCWLCLGALILYGWLSIPVWSFLMQSPPFPSLTQGVQHSRLPNGLTVLTKEVHTAPVVTVQVWYQVGSQHEPRGWNGISHQLEHLLFKGTRNRPIQFGRLFSALGSDSNAFTSYDQTAYFGTVERTQLRTLLVLEADRMQHTLIDSERLASEQRVVISELQGYENDPAYRLDRKVMAAVFPELTYGLPVGGTQSDVEGFTVAQVEAYYRTHYRPENAVLVIVGDFANAPTLKAVTEIFGSIPNLPQPQVTTPSPATVPTQPPSAIHLQEPGSAALLEVVYPLPNIHHPDIPALHILDLILTEGRNSRLEQSLVESGLASQISSYPANLAGVGWYQFTAIAAPGHSLARLDQVLQQSLAKVQNHGVTPTEVQRAQRQLKAAMVLWNRDITSQAMQLGNDQTTAGDYRFSDRYLQAIAQVSADDVQRVAKIYLHPQRRTLGYFEPTHPNGDPEINLSNRTQTQENFSVGAPVDAAAVSQYLPTLIDITPELPQPLPTILTLTNGLQILMLRDASTPTVTLSGFIRAGSEFDPMAKAGLAQLTAENLLNGTPDKDALTLDQILADRGTSLEFNTYREGVVITGNALNTDLPILVAVLAAVLRQPSFPVTELELSRQQALTSLKMALDDPAQLARRLFQQGVYPMGHPWHQFPTSNSLRAITRSDLVNFHQRHYRPDTVVLCLVGDFEITSLGSHLAEEFDPWPTSPRQPSLTYPRVTLPPHTTTLDQALAGKAQAFTYLGHPGIDRQDPHFYAALVLNQILGGGYPRQSSGDRGARSPGLNLWDL
ncbi:insulinase family protein [Neosynechococcus sphagnicola]|uniref:insulinase family protein n=1 Tax=Neosynechococcus sphagnicola TaxID=1501145 RepID=UPI000A9C23D2|nr:insulinase family protein [Neosynechococcus sphagnicola]